MAKKCEHNWTPARTEPAAPEAQICGAFTTYEDAPELHTGCALNRGHEGLHSDGDYSWEPPAVPPAQEPCPCKISTSGYVYRLHSPDCPNVQPSPKPASAEPNFTRCFCLVCLAKRRRQIGVLSREEQFDFEAWHVEPMIGWRYRQLGYMARSLIAEAQLATLQQSRDKLVKLIASYPILPTFCPHNEETGYCDGCKHLYEMNVSAWKKEAESLLAALREGKEVGNG